MFRKHLSLALAGLLLHTASTQPAFAQSKAGAQAQLVEKVKTQILHLGVGETSRVTVKLRNNAKMDGYISRVGEESFEVTNKKRSRGLKKNSRLVRSNLHSRLRVVEET